VSENLLLDALNRELAAASPELVGSGDLLRGILSGCGDCIKVLDLDGRLQFMSDGGKRVMEVDNFDALKGCPWPDFWSGEGNAQAHAAVAAAKDGRMARFQNAANTAKGNPRHWDVQVSPIFGHDGKPAHLLSISRDITAEWLAIQAEKQAAERHKFLTEELTHRVKNTLATVLAIAGQTFRGETYKQARDIFNARIRTLDEAYKILTEASWSSGSMHRVADSALAPYRTDGDRFSIAGPEHDLRPHQALTMALALNELATNAMKYGALTSPTGRVEISWSVAMAENSPAFQFEWRESGGPEVVAPARSGFGSRLIKTMLSSDFGGAVDILYEPGGLVCVLRAPLR
jgi:two-component sensor histidine kinase